MKMKRIYYVMMALLFCAVSINAQVTIGDNTDPHDGAVLELKSSNKGLLLPRVSLSNVATYGLEGTASSAAGMVVYNTNDNITDGNGVGVYVWDGAKWGQIASSNNNGGNNSGGDCGAWLDVEQTQWLVFMCHNLGADETVGSSIPAAAIHGAKYQWGKKLPALNQANDQSNPNSISGWGTAAADDAWLDTEKTANDPCPVGWRVPTKAQWEAVVAYNAQTIVGSDWTSNTLNYSTGMLLANRLFLPAAGVRNNNGALLGRGNYGYYWSSTINNTLAYSFSFRNTGATPADTSHRTNGISVRCVADN